MAANSLRDPPPYLTANFLIEFALILRSSLGEVGGQLPPFVSRGDANELPLSFVGNKTFYGVGVAGPLGPALEQPACYLQVATPRCRTRTHV